MLLVLVLAGPFVYIQVRDSLDESLDEGLVSRADDLASAVSNAPGAAPDLGLQRVGDSEDAFSQVLSTGVPAFSRGLSPHSTGSWSWRRGCRPRTERRPSARCGPPSGSAFPF